MVNLIDYRKENKLEIDQFVRILLGKVVFFFLDLVIILVQFRFKFLKLWWCLDIEVERKFFL